MEKYERTIEKYIKTIERFFELKDTPESTRESTLRRVFDFLLYVKKVNGPIVEITFEDMQDYILHLKRDRGLSAGTINNHISAMRLLYTYVLEKEWNPNKVPRMKRKQSFPIIPPREDVFTLLDATSNLKHKAIFALIYGSGLRVSEVAKLKIKDIDSKNMRVRVDDAKHNTNRYTILSMFALTILREYFKAYFHGPYHSNDWLFLGQNKIDHIHVKSIKNTFIKVRNRLDLDYTISAHTLRHCFATHSLENRTDPVHIQHMLGHKRLETTNAYMHMTSKSLMGIKSPLDDRGGHS